MRARSSALLAASFAFALAACAGTGTGAAIIPTYQIVRGPIAAAPGHSLVTRDIVLAPGGLVPLHYHHGEEFLAVIGGSATLERPGMPDLVLQAGEGVRIPPATVHAAKAGPDGLRAVASWVLPDGKPLREAAPAGGER
mgnify:CR=1 FL=1